jgi:aminobenzoyl-glutamate utilization protein B
MARAGAFSDADVVLAWHPGSSNGASLGSSLANINAKFRFHGIAAHAAGNPDKGRSSLDALLLTAHCVDMMREHVPQETRIHYIFTKGGEAPNVVPDFAEGYFYARSPSMPVLDQVWDRINKCAQAGALGTETRLETELVNSVYNLLPNEPLTRLLDSKLKMVGGVKYSPEERQFAESLVKTFPPSTLTLGSDPTDVGNIGGAYRSVLHRDLRARHPRPFLAVHRLRRIVHRPQRHGERRQGADPRHDGSLSEAGVDHRGQVRFRQAPRRQLI